MNTYIKTLAWSYKILDRTINLEESHYSDEAYNYSVSPNIKKEDVYKFSQAIMRTVLDQMIDGLSEEDISNNPRWYKTVDKLEEMFSIFEKVCSADCGHTCYSFGDIHTVILKSEACEPGDIRRAVVTTVCNACKRKYVSSGELLKNEAEAIQWMNEPHNHK